MVRKKRTSQFKLLTKKYTFILLFILVLVGAIYYYKAGIMRYLGFEYDKNRGKNILSEIRNLEILRLYQKNPIGLDVSEFQGKINWSVLDTLDKKYPISFVFVRSTAGCNHLDVQFKTNWKAVKQKKMIRGAYHYYRPNENSLEQAQFFIKTVRLEKGDLPPVLDIEKLPKQQSMNNLKLGLKRWLDAVENHYGVQPIIYSSDKYYTDFLKDSFKNYTFWIANYTFYTEEIDENWLFWQFTQKGNLPGIKGNVDVSVYNGNMEQLQFLTIHPF